MKYWVRFLPLFIVVWLAKKYCARQPLYDEIVIQPFEDILIRTETNKEIKERRKREKLVFDKEKTEWKYQS